MPFSIGVGRLDMTFLINMLPFRACCAGGFLGGNSLPTWRKLPGVVSTQLA